MKLYKIANQLNFFMQSWHLIGTIGTIICSLVLFTPPIWHIQDDCIKSGTCTDEIAMVAYYSVLAAALNIAIAFIQIPHMAMIPEITSSEVVRGSLSNTRPILGNVGYLVLYGITWALIGSGNISRLLLKPFYILLVSIESLIYDLCFS